VRRNLVQKLLEFTRKLFHNADYSISFETPTAVVDTALLPDTPGGDEE
jgi:hypothetical protein